jgi:hypothetical protein
LTALGEHPSTKECQNELGEVIGRAVVGVVGARYHYQLTSGEKPEGGLGPGHRHDGLDAAPSDRQWHLDLRQLALDRITKSMCQGPSDPAWPSVADVANQDR